jgi:chromate reductase, NAD(P)H dehydrogenase (quinone)
MNQQINILGFAGSLRKDSYNRALLKASFKFVPVDANLEIVELAGIPSFNQDLETSVPEKVQEFKRKIKEADALLIVTPEYNYSIPGVLKNAMDWASRPRGDNSFENKPVAIMSASTGILGGARAQYHLRQSCVFLNMFPLNKPEIFVTLAGQKFDLNGTLLDQKTGELIGQLLTNLVAWTRKLQTNSPT